MEGKKDDSYRRIKSLTEDILFATQIKNPPVSLKIIIKYIQRKNNVSIQFIKRTLPEEYSGQILVVEREVAIIFNSKDNLGRQRFTIAHELGHLVLDHLAKTEFELESVKIVNTKSQFEKEANSFAVNLLMPDSLMKKEKIDSKDDIIILAKKYQVSYEAMNFKVCTSNYLSGVTLDKTDHFQKMYKEKEDSQNIEEDMRPIEEGSYDDLAKRIYSKD